jgi:diaminohydroxyphosphoribosylaminopyrimidine deaminase/5-amino-6-(5-phosphoribosylamino)uracil reductase
MSVALHGPSAEAAAAHCWQALTLLADEVRGHRAPIVGCSLLLGDEPRVCLGASRPPAAEGWSLSVLVDADAAGQLPPADAGEARYALDDVIALCPLTAGDLHPSARDLIELYLPYCLAPVHARRMGRAFTVSHFAQSLDGRIATCDGDARWIGCMENRIHAHRMRALCDGILIGAQTLRNDRPALTVRHAEGTDPTRIVLGAATDVSCLQRAGPGAIVLIGDGDGDGSESGQVERFELPRNNGQIDTGAILERLYECGILSVYVEGGATTTSTFLTEGNIDVVQLHFSPMILGTGISSFTGPAVPSVQDAVRFRRHLYREVGDGMMFVGTIAP